MTITAYERRVRELEAEGLTRSDAQGVADAEAIKAANLIEAEPRMSDLSFDGRGINGPLPDRARVATFTDAARADKYGALLAAAPDLLAALKATLTALEAHLDEDALAHGLKHRDLLCPCNQNEVVAAKAAIAKAEGMA